LRELDRGLDTAAVGAFRDRFQGQIVLPHDESYDALRVVWNAVADRYPALVVRPNTEDDVATALRFAREQDLTVAVRGGGHSVAGHSTCDGGMVIDLRSMQRVEVDPKRRVARVQGGVLLSQLDEAAQAFGLACPVGVVGHTGIGGLGLGGGMGRLQRKYGLTVDNILGLEMVTADGRMVRVDHDENADLFWGMRGAGPNFGVVTSFELHLHEVGPVIVHGMVMHPLERAREMVARHCDLVASAPDEAFLGLNFTLALPEEDFPPEIAGRPIVAAGVAHCGPVEEGERYAEQLRGDGAVLDTIAPKRYLDVQSMGDEAMAWGHRFYMKGGFVPGIPDEMVDVCAERIADAPGECEISFWAFGGAIARVPEDAMAFTGRDAGFWCGVESLWDDPSRDDQFIAWTRTTMDALQPFTTAGNYVNDIVETGTGVVRAIYGDAKYERLRALKRAWDPDNVFRLNQNVKP
jgi:FAD/FMN-containing dehydrogenase